jgi:hypothetical protein
VQAKELLGEFPIIFAQSEELMALKMQAAEF